MSECRGTLSGMGKPVSRGRPAGSSGRSLLGLLLGFSILISACGTAAIDAAGEARPPSSTGPTSRPQHAPEPGAATARSPLDNSRGLLSGLAPIAPSQRPAATAIIAELPTKGRGPKTGYSRSQFGRTWTDLAAGVPFAFNGCYTRDDILRRDLTSIQVRPGTNDCVVLAGDLADPYSGTPLRFRKEQAADIQIDHVFPLSLAWQMGASGWGVGRRTRFANDPLNLLAADGRQNEIKSDSGPASWLPPNKAIRCAYSVRFAQVASSYQLAVPVPDKEVMARLCSESG